MFLDFGNVDNSTDEELYKIIEEKSNHYMSDDDIKCVLNTINKFKKEVDEKIKKEENK